MLFGKKAAVTLSSMILLSAISACSSNVTPMAVAVNGDASFANSNLVTRISQNVTQSKQDPNHFYVDAGNGQTTGASVTVKINLGNGGFKTKSANGKPAKVASDVASFDVALIDAASAPSNIPATITSAQATAGLKAFGNITKNITNTTPTADGLIGGPGVTGVGVTPSATGTPSAATIITFTNVADSSGAYYVAVAAKEVTTGVNITNPSGTLDNTTGPGALLAGKYYVSSNSIAVTKEVSGGKALYKVSSTGDLTVPLYLLDATTGADLTSVVTVNDGTTAALSSTTVGIQ